MRNTSGHYYLNGNWRIDFPREMKFAGASFHYERKPHAFIAPESITALGPTTEPLYICVSLFCHHPQSYGIRWIYLCLQGTMINLTAFIITFSQMKWMETTVYSIDYWFWHFAVAVPRDQLGHWILLQFPQRCFSTSSRQLQLDLRKLERMFLQLWRR